VHWLFKENLDTRVLKSSRNSALL